jgi:hypothetical protein
LEFSRQSKRNYGSKNQIHGLPYQKMRTHTMHKQKPVFKFEGGRASHSLKREMMEALQAVIDAYGDSDTLLMMQCRRALDRAKGGA